MTYNFFYCYFLIPTSNENNLIYLFIIQTPGGEIKHSFCSSWVALVVESRSILYSSKIVCLQVDWFTVYNRIMIE